MGDPLSFVFPYRTLSVNAEQSAAIRASPTTHQRILASAGSGKTTTLTARIAWLVQTHHVPPQSVVLVTFSRNATQQMRERLEALLGPTDVWIGTFHSLARSLIARYDSAKLQTLYFLDELVSMGIAWLGSPRGRKWVASIQYCVVDEFQDINATQWRFLQMILKNPACRLIVVGDDAQNIYTWRGSDVRYILDLPACLGDSGSSSGGRSRVCDNQLSSNYRSTHAIVAVANSVLKHIPSLPWKKYMRARSTTIGARPEVHFFWRSQDEAAWVFARILALQTETPRTTCAVLSRTNSTLYGMEEFLQAQHYPYRLRDVFEENATATAAPSRPHVDIVTIHASKGLEWDHVFLMNCNDDIFPTKKTPVDIVHERRLFYVSVTRARTTLTLTYTKKERTLCRFVREIPRTLLLYSGLAQYSLSDVDRTEGRPRLRDILESLDGNRLQELRARGVFATIERDRWTTERFFPSGLWSVPSWAMQYDKGGDFHRFLRIWLFRFIWRQIAADDEPFCDPVLESILFTLRVYAEEREFFLQWQSEIYELFHTWFDSTHDSPKNVEYSAVKAWAEQKNLFWSVADLIQATTLLAKLRGQLRPLRFVPYDLNDFRIGSARYIVPTEWRADALRSWKRVADRSLENRALLTDLWRLGALELCAEGRNAALYRVQEMSGHLSECSEFFEALGTGIRDWLATRAEDRIAASVAAQFSVELHVDAFYTEVLDIVLPSEGGSTFWHICTEEKMDSLSILELAVRGSLARQHDGIPLTAVGWIQSLDGVAVSFPIGEAWDRCVMEEILAGSGGGGGGGSSGKI